MANALGNNGGRSYSFLNRPVSIDCNFIVDATNGNGLGVRSVKGAGIRNIFMHTSATPGLGLGGFLNPNPPSGYAIVQMHTNYNRYCGGFDGFVSPTTGGTLAINGTALTANNPYIVASVGVGSAGTATIAPVADSAGSLASTWFRLFDSYGNTFIIWFSVSGVGSAPSGVGGTLVQQTISSGATAAQIGTALVLTIQNLPSGVAGVNSFTASGTTTVTVVSTVNVPLAGVPFDGAIPTGFTFALTKYTTNQQCWNGVGLQKGVVPSVGASFIAANTGFSTGGGSTGLVVAAGVSGITKVELVGDPNQTIAPIPMNGSPNYGAYLMVQFLGATNSSTTTLIPTAPAAGSVCGLSFVMEAGSIIIQGE